MLDQIAAQAAGLPACRDGTGDGLECPGDISCREGVDQIRQWAVVVVPAADGG